MAISNSDPDMSFRDLFICAALSSSLLEALPVADISTGELPRNSRVNRSLLCEKSWPTELIRKKSVVLMIVLTLVLLHRF